MKLLNFLSLVIFLSCGMVVKSDLKIEVMKEGLLDLKTTILRSPNITEFTGSANEPYIGGTTGELVPFFPNDGCGDLIETEPFTTKIDTGALRFNPVNGKSEQVIVLMSRGGCSFNVKFSNAKKIKGVVGVLVYNGPDDTLPLEKIQLTNTSEDLPGFLISNTLGLELMNKVSKYRSSSSSGNASSPSYIEITMTPMSIDATNKANTMIQLALISIIIILALSFGASIIIHMRSPYINAQNSNNTNDPNSHDSLKPIDVEFLQKLPLKTYKGRRKSADKKQSSSSDNSPKPQESNDNISNSTNISNNNDQGISYSGIKSPSYCEDEKALINSNAGSPLRQDGNIWFEMIQHEWPMNDSCPICLDEFNQGEVLNELPCGHCYHIACIQPWLQYRSPCCPLCKLDVREEFKPAKVEFTNDKKQEGDGEENDNNNDNNYNQHHKLKNIWNKLILKSSKATNTSEMTQIPASSNAIAIQMPQRALINESENFQSVPL